MYPSLRFGQVKGSYAMFRKILLSYRGVILKTKSLLVSLLALTSTIQGTEGEASLQGEIYRLSPFTYRFIKREKV